MPTRPKTQHCRRPTEPKAQIFDGVESKRPSVPEVERANGPVLRQASSATLWKAEAPEAERATGPEGPMNKGLKAPRVEDAYPLLCRGPNSFRGPEGRGP